MSPPLILLSCRRGAELRGEGRRPGADLRAGPGSVRRGGQDEARAQRPDHGGEGELATDNDTNDDAAATKHRSYAATVLDPNGRAGVTNAGEFG